MFKNDIKIFEYSWKIWKFRLLYRKSAKQECFQRNSQIIKKNIMKHLLHTNASKKSMIKSCNIWKMCLELNWFVYDPSWMLHLSEFVWILRSSVWVVLNNFLLIDATNRSKIWSDQKRFFIALSLYPLSFFVNTPFKRNFFSIRY